MLGKAVSEISALNKKAAGVPDSSVLSPMGQVLHSWRSRTGLL